MCIRDRGSAGAATDAAADQGVHLMLRKEPSQGAVAAADGADHLGGNHLAVLDIIEFKLFAVAEVLEQDVYKRQPQLCFGFDQAAELAQAAGFTHTNLWTRDGLRPVSWDEFGKGRE